MVLFFWSWEKISRATRHCSTHMNSIHRILGLLIFCIERRWHSRRRAKESGNTRIHCGISRKQPNCSRRRRNLTNGWRKSIPSRPALQKQRQNSGKPSAWPRVRPIRFHFEELVSIPFSTQEHLNQGAGRVHHEDHRT